MSDRLLPAVSTKGLPGAGPLTRSNIPPYVFARRFESEKRKHPFSPQHLGKKNPYTDCAVNSESDYYEYLQQHTYLMLCDELVVKQTKEIRETAQNDITWLQNQNEHLKKSLSDIERKHRRLRILCLILAVLLAAAVVFLISRAPNEKSASASRVIQSSSDSRSYSNGNTPEKNGGLSGIGDTEKTTESTSGKHTGGDSTGMHRDEPIAITYIGNKNSKKFHKPTCSYLPDKANQVTFDTREEAVAAGYSPCGHCSP